MKMLDLQAAKEGVYREIEYKITATDKGEGGTDSISALTSQEGNLPKNVNGFHTQSEIVVVLESGKPTYELRRFK